MCLAVPVKIEEIEGNRGVAALEGSRMNVLLNLVPDAKVGDWILMHAGFAITILDEADARETYDLLKQMQ